MMVYDDRQAYGQKTGKQSVAAERQSPILSGFGLDFPCAVIFFQHIFVFMSVGFPALLLRLTRVVAPQSSCAFIKFYHIHGWKVYKG